LPTNPVSVTGGTGSGATFNVTWAVQSLTITNAGSGYVEQPTVTFSGGGGSGAAAYATVGSGTTVRSLGSTLDFYTPNAGIGLRIEDSQGTGAAYFRLRAGGGTAGLLATAGASISSASTNSVSLFTNSFLQEQLRVSHTASAVNFVQVTGSATSPAASALPNITAQGSDTNTYLAIGTRGSGGYVSFHGNASTGHQVFRISTLNAAANASYLQVQANASGGTGPVLSAQGSDTNIDLSLTPKGTGLVRFGTYTANMALTVQGYIEIKDSGGTTRRLAVVA
jgi:hypothetical protein